MDIVIFDQAFNNSIYQMLEYIQYNATLSITNNTNTFLLNSVIEYITSIKRFNDPLILYYKKKVIPLGDS